ncbi:Transposon Ty3-I Gag-Pol polyprotein [Senna tora]|uniref:Transposon Ty3-I Gag-Pol polyprotein n=1 Tax=Senna tora TaxID=362788 RepID=A0A834SFD8_9FABA|nr:Transposon Ty3-I Gag-Pol polyprotein [Senna tora]
MLRHDPRSSHAMTTPIAVSKPLWFANTTRTDVLDSLAQQVFCLVSEIRPLFVVRNMLRHSPRTSLADMDQNANQDDLHLPTGPITRAKAKRIQQAMQGLMKQVHGDEADFEELGIEHELKAVNILHVQLKPK